MSYRKINLSLLVILCAYSFVFLVFPEFDIWISRMLIGKLYNHEMCSKLTGTIKKAITVFIFSVGLFYFILAAIAYYFNSRNQVNAFTKAYCSFLKSGSFLLFNLLIIGGLMIEAIKSIFARLRPNEITNFGGRGVYEMVFNISGACKGNCSFPSGDATVGFLIFPLLLALTRKPLLSFIIGLTSGLLFSYCRISAGKHFLSDVIFSGIVVCYFASVSYLYLMKPKLAR